REQPRGGGDPGARSCLLPGDRHQDRQRDRYAAPPTERPCGDLRIQGKRPAPLVSFLRSSSAGLLPSETAGYPSNSDSARGRRLRSPDQLPESTRDPMSKSTGGPPPWVRESPAETGGEGGGRGGFTPR